MKRYSITRENAVRKILNSSGRFFTVTWQLKKETKKLNGKFTFPPTARRNQDKIYGYLTVFDVHAKQYRRVDTRKITSLNTKGVSYKVR